MTQREARIATAILLLGWIAACVAVVLSTGCTSTSAQVERAAAGCLCAAQKCEAVVSASGQATANADVMLRQLNGKPK